jgi:hypothetical protein
VELRQYLHAVALADHASFCKASEALGISDGYCNDSVRNGPLDQRRPARVASGTGLCRTSPASSTESSFPGAVMSTGRYPCSRNPIGRPAAPTAAMN